MQKIIVINPANKPEDTQIKEVSWDGSMKHIAEILGVTKKLKEEINKQYDDEIEIMIMENTTMVSGVFAEKYAQNYHFAIAGMVYNCKVAMVGLNNILFDKPLLTIEEVKESFTPIVDSHEYEIDENN